MIYLYNTQYNILYYHGYLYPSCIQVARYVVLYHTTTIPPLALTVGIELLLYERMDRVRYLNS